MHDVVCYVGMLLQGGLPFVSSPSTTGAANPTTLQQGPPLLPPGAIQGTPTKALLACVDP